MNGVNIGEVGQLENSQTEEERKDQNDEKLPEIDEEEKHVICIDDVTSKELPWHATNEKNTRHSESMNVKTLHNARSLQSTRSGLIQTKQLRESPCKSDHEVSQESSKVTIAQMCTQTLLHWKR